MTFRSKNEKLGRLTPLRHIGKSSHGKPVWLFQCDCGKLVERIINTAIRTAASGGTPSCGCYKYQRPPFPSATRLAREEQQEEEAHSTKIAASISENRACVPASLQQLTGRIISIRHTTGRSFSRSHLPQQHSSTFNMMNAV
jgi:hypothetical protein